MFLLEQGEWVRLKTFEAGTAPELQPSCLRLLRKVGLQRAWRGAVNGVPSGDPVGLDWSLLNVEASHLRKEVLLLARSPPHCQHIHRNYTPSPSPSLTSIPKSCHPLHVIIAMTTRATFPSVSPPVCIQHHQRASSCTCRPSTHLPIYSLFIGTKLCSGFGGYSHGEETGSLPVTYHH